MDEMNREYVERLHGGHGYLTAPAPGVLTPTEIASAARTTAVGCTQGGCRSWGVRDAVGYRDRCGVHARAPPAAFDRRPTDQRRRAIARAIADPDNDGYPRADEEASLFVESEDRRRATQG